MSEMCDRDVKLWEAIPKLETMVSVMNDEIRNLNNTIASVQEDQRKVCAIHTILEGVKHVNIGDLPLKDILSRNALLEKTIFDAKAQLEEIIKPEIRFCDETESDTIDVAKDLDQAHPSSSTYKETPKCEVTVGDAIIERIQEFGFDPDAVKSVLDIDSVFMFGDAPAQVLLDMKWTFDHLDIVAPPWNELRINEVLGKFGYQRIRAIGGRSIERVYPHLKGGGRTWAAVHYINPMISMTSTIVVFYHKSEDHVMYSCLFQDAAQFDFLNVFYDGIDVTFGRWKSFIHRFHFGEVATNTEMYRKHGFGFIKTSYIKDEELSIPGTWTLRVAHREIDRYKVRYPLLVLPLSQQPFEK